MHAFAAFTEEAQALRPRIAVVLGSGWGLLTERCRIERELSYLEVPHLDCPSVPGHKGRVLLGFWADQPVLVFSGRLHHYEGHAGRGVCQPVHVAQALGAQIVVLTNAAGGIRPDLTPGSLMALDGHLSLVGSERWKRLSVAPGSGLVTAPYCPRLREALLEAGREAGVPVKRGVYAQVTGPCYETPAEIRAFRSCGADAVGMSTGKESEAAHALGLRCVGLSCITNAAAGLSALPIQHEEVTALALTRTEALGTVLECFLRGGACQEQ